MPTSNNSRTGSGFCCEPGCVSGCSKLCSTAMRILKVETGAGPIMQTAGQACCLKSVLYGLKKYIQ